MTNGGMLPEKGKKILYTRQHAWAVEVLNTQLPYTHIQRDDDSCTAHLNRKECTCLRSKF